MLGIRLVRPTATRALAFSVLLATYGGGTLTITGIAATTGVSTAFAKSNSNRGFSSSPSVGNRMSSAGGARSSYRSYGPRYGVGNQMSGTPKPPKTSNKTLSIPGAGNKTNTSSSSPSVGSAGEIRSVGASFERGPVYGDAGLSGTSGRGNAIETCAQRYRSYDRATMTYADPNGRRRSCP